MNSQIFRIAPLALCFGLAACASAPPSGPTVGAIPGPNVSQRTFVHDDSACRARAYGATQQAAAVGGAFGLQGQYNSIYGDCMLDRGYTISERVVAGYDYGPGPAFVGPGPFYYGGPVVSYGWSGGWAGGVGTRGAWGGPWGHRW